MPFIAESDIMQQKKAFCKKIATTPIPLLILGEAGVGKRFVAQFVHDADTRAKQCHTFNCANLSVNDFARFVSEWACGTRCTVVLGEVGLLTYEAQQVVLAQLLGKRSEAIRWIATSSQNIEAMAETGAFLPALYRRINAIPLNIPALRERRDDIMPLAQHFIEYYARQLYLGSVRVDDEGRQLIEQWEWRGNVSELRYVIARSLAQFASTGCLKDGCLTKDTLCLEKQGVPLSIDKSLKEAVHSFKKEYIHAVLREHGGNQRKTAQVLGIQRTYLVRLLKELA